MIFKRIRINQIKINWTGSTFITKITSGVFFTSLLIFSSNVSFNRCIIFYFNGLIINLFINNWRFGNISCWIISWLCLGSSFRLTISGCLLIWRFIVYSLIIDWILCTFISNFSFKWSILTSAIWLNRLNTISICIFNIGRFRVSSASISRMNLLWA